MSGVYTELTPPLEELLSLFREKPRNIPKLRECGRVHGFANDYGRNLAWNTLVDSLDVENHKDEPFEVNKRRAAEVTPNQKTVHQIHIDVERSLNTIDYFENLPEDKIKYHRENLEDLLQTFFALNPQYAYYQGFHDITTILLYMLGKDAAFRAMQKLSYVYFRDSLKYPFEASVTLQLRLILKIVRNFDPWLADLIDEFYSGAPIFALPWMITWFSHSLNKISEVARLFDFLISSPPSSVIYMCAAVILTQKKDLIAAAGGEDIDMGTLHMFFQHLKMPNIELLISTTIELEKTVEFSSIITTLDKTFPEQSSVGNSKNSDTINKYYRHKLEKESEALLPTIVKKSKGLISKPVVVVGVATALVLIAVLSKKFPIRKI